MKKVVYWFITALLFFAFAPNARAEGEIKLSLDTIGLLKGESYTFDVISNMEEITEGSMVIVTTSKYITLTSIVLKEGLNVTNKDSMTSFKTNTPIKKGEVIGKVTIKVSTNAPVGTTGTISFSSLSFKNKVGKIAVNPLQLNVSVIAEKEKAKDTSLSSLTSKTTQIPFTTEQTEYEVKVQNSVKKMDIEAKANHPKASVTISNQNLVEGENTISIMVTAENGDQKEYKVKVIRESLEKEESKVQSNKGLKIAVLAFSLLVVLTDILYIVKYRK